ncbi:TonB-dependent receptor [Arachidicoccus soli]|uniref:TonB-dependent receptor n=1 Tax=Arachidicoccus soli TaxID=2341117 RepID=A0A386HQ80_9BACT|nr:TonB-dependent receptor [Arachidicoccus soli]AYD47852.1 TonB-dependent receptor [Arachidicoccus soli]
MKLKYFLLLVATLFVTITTLCAQRIIKGKIIDKETKEAIAGVLISTNTGAAYHTHAISNLEGDFKMSIKEGDSLVFTDVNYQTKRIKIGSRVLIVELSLQNHRLDQVVVSGDRFNQNRKDIPAAISVVSKHTINETKATQLDQLVNKVPGVFMVDLGNEQHEMSIRQPMSTKSLFLYLEDGIPIRATGLYNHNALLEMNMAAMQRIEVLKGPASAQYGAEAVGGAINVITTSPPAIPSGKLSIQKDNNGYNRIDAQAGNTFGKFGAVLSGYFADRKNGPIAYSDFHKTAITLNTVYAFSNSLKWINSATYIDYYSDMSGSLDSAAFARKDFSSDYTFTYRRVKAFRAKSELEKQWNDHSNSRLTFMYRNNNTGQNPSYYIKDSRTNPLAASGQINDNRFQSFVGIAQHQQKFDWLQSKLTVGLSADISPSHYMANYINIQKNASGKYVSYTSPDSLLTKYSTGINNYAAFVQYELNPFNHLKIVGAARYDLFSYNFKNALSSSAVSGSPSSIQHFQRLTPKVGFTYNLNSIGFYGNYAQGFVPPQVTDLFNNVKVPFLKPQVFDNYEIGGWISFVRNILYVDWSLYRLDGTNEIISVRNDDGSFENANAGKTRHTGIEYGLHFTPNQQWELRVSGTDAQHKFIQDIEKGVDYSGNEMSTAPHFLFNTEAVYHPAFIKGFRIGVEWQKMGSYFMDDANTTKYKGFNVFNLRAGYQMENVELWVNALNVLNKYYSDIATKSSYGYSYNLGNPFTIAFGVSYHFGK